MEVNSVLAAMAAAVSSAQLQGNTMTVTATDTPPLVPAAPHFYPNDWVASYSQTFGGNSSLTGLLTTWHLVLSAADDAAGHQEAMALSSSGESTIRAALNAARGAPGQAALGGAADDLHVRTARGPLAIKFGNDVAYWGVEFTIFVMG